MIPAVSWRIAQMPHARSGDSCPVIGRRTRAVIAIALRERKDPRAGTPSFMQCSQYQMVTLVNGSFGELRSPRPPAAPVRCR
jgi:hypothetical protein